MTILTPTSDVNGAPAGLPDVATLARLAGEFFAALPGQSGAAAAAPAGMPTLPGSVASLPLSPTAGSLPTSAAPPLPAGAPSGPVVPDALSASSAVPGGVPGANLAPSAPQQVLSLGANAPALVPHAVAPNGVPDQALVAAPGADGRAGGVVLGVPQAFAAALPSLPETAGGAPVPSTPYYFLGESSAYQPPAQGVPGIDDRISAQSFGLPGADQLRALLAVPSPAAVPAAAPAASPASGFYFLEPSRDPHAFGAKVPNAAASAHPPFDVNAVRRDFPILGERVNGRPLVWFDNAATTQKPRAVIERLSYFYEHENSNIHRAAHELAARATDAYESARDKVARFVGASSAEEIVFVRGCTEAINLIAQSWGRKNVGEGDEIIVSHLEHHANIVPWQQLASEKGAKIRVIPVDDTGQVLLEEYKRLINDRTKIVSVTQVSNALGTVVPVKEIVDIAHRAGVCALVDGAQSVSHMRVNVQALDADFFVFSGHKIFGPTGIGVVYGKRAVLEDMPPWQGGGNMIADVTFERTVFQPPPSRFEAGTGNIADAVGLGAALDYVDRIGIENIARYEHDLLDYATHHMRPIPGLRLIGTARDKASVLSFVLDGYKPEEVGKALNQEGIAVRSGHHCAQPILRRFGVEATVRPSLAFYNTCEEIDRMVAVVRRLAGQRS
jgi:cysteine desulfurase/selenocysteine lyase